MKVEVFYQVKHSPLTGAIQYELKHPVDVEDWDFVHEEDWDDIESCIKESIGEDLDIKIVDLVFN